MEEKDKIQIPKTITRHINRFFLDPNNYRFIDHNEYRKVPEDNLIDPQVQKRTRNLLLGKNNENVKDLIVSFKENGFLPVDQIQVRELPDGNVLVIEGNRRIATLQYFYEEWKNNGIEIGKLQESDFRSVPSILLPGEALKMHLIVMGLKHISGNKKWNTVNQAQYIEDLFKNYNMTEEEVCDSLGITKHAFRRSRRTLALVKQYKKSDFGDQFESPMYSLFEEIVRSTDFKKWLDWNDEEYAPINNTNLERIFTWISSTEDIEYNESGEIINRKILEPIISKAQEIRSVAKYIQDENAVKKMEESRNVTEGYIHSDALGENKFIDAMEKVKENASTLFHFSEHMKPQNAQELLRLRDKIDRLIPTTMASIATGGPTPLAINPAIAKHFSEITIKQFRRLNHLKLKNLNRINILAGMNNSGKTSVLEAVYLLANLNDIDAFFEMEKYRAKFSGDLNAKWLESNFFSRIEIEGIFNGETANVSLESVNTTDPIDKSGYLTSIALYSEYARKEMECNVHLYSDKESSSFFEEKVILCNSIMTSPYRFNDRDLKKAHMKAIKEKNIEIVIDFICQAVDPTIQKIEMVNIDGINRFVVTSEKFDKAIDLTNYGEGLQRIFEIALFFAYAADGVLLIDEFDTAIHKSLLIDFSRFVHELAEKFNVQVFLTSHSKECIDAFIKNNYRPQDITAFKLKEEMGTINCKYIDGIRLRSLLESIDVDIREA